MTVSSCNRIPILYSLTFLEVTAHSSINIIHYSYCVCAHNVLNGIDTIIIYQIQEICKKEESTFKRHNRR